MNKILKISMGGVLGLGLGGASAYATALIAGPARADVKAAPKEDEGTFVPGGKLLAPLVFPDGSLSGYVSFEFSVEVEAEQAEAVSARMPLLLNAINMRTHRTPMAVGPNGQLPDVALFRKLVMDAAAEAFGKGAVTRAAITRTEPA